MTITPCPTCHIAVPDHSNFCPECGTAIAGARDAPAVPIMTIELTSKRWKALFVRGWILTTVGLLAAFSGASPVVGIVGSLAGLFGCGMLLYAVAMRWWHHG